MNRTLIGCFASTIFAVILSSSGTTRANQKSTSILIQHVLIVDGSGRTPYLGDVRVSGSRIAAVAVRLMPAPGEEVINEYGKGLALSPGFIDMHSHTDRGLFEDPTADVMVRQGITTSLIGQDGESEYPLADYLEKIQDMHTSLNIASMVGQGTLREQAMGEGAALLHPSTPQQLARMKQVLAQELNAGAFGMSTGLEYDPAHFSTTEEIIELSKVASQTGGFYISHVRDEGNHVFDSFHEVEAIGKGANIPVEISHIKLGTTPVWHMAVTEMPKIFADAQRQGIDLKADVYPYTHWHSGIRVIMLDRDYFNPQKVAQAIRENGGADHITFVHYEPDPAANGKNLQQIADMWHITPVEAYMRIVKATTPGPNGDGPSEDVIVASMSEDDVERFVANSRVMFCTDGGLNMHHPRSAGTFPRILGRYVRERKILSLQEAIRKATSMPAHQLGLKDRGMIAPGFAADLVLFNPATVIDTATIQHWDAPPVGIPDVMVNGRWVLRDGKITGERPGKVIRHAAGSQTGNS